MSNPMKCARAEAGSPTEQTSARKRHAGWLMMGSSLG
jgi:hypothetical protein